MPPPDLVVVPAVAAAIVAVVTVVLAVFAIAVALLAIAVGVGVAVIVAVFYDSVPRDERAVLVYLVGELWRRIGDARQANAWFDMVPNEVTDSTAQRWVLEVARRQQTDPREWFA